MKLAQIPKSKLVQWSLLSGLACVFYVMEYRNLAILLMIFSVFPLASKEEVSRVLKWRRVVRILSVSTVMLVILLCGAFHWWNGNGAGAHQPKSWVSRLWFIAIWLIVACVTMLRQRTEPALSGDDTQEKQEAIHES